MPEVEFGKPMWQDLTVEDPSEIVPFYEAVLNWAPKDHDMGGYVDHAMTAPNGDTVAGLCHARGENAKLPPVWLLYFAVPSLEDALAKVRDNGGEVIDEREAFAVVRDPAGAHLALWQQQG